MRCGIHDSCTGFGTHVLKPDICKECSFSKAHASEHAELGGGGGGGAWRVARGA
jgi:hypothetical protein